MEEQNGNQNPEQPKAAHGRGWTIGVIILVIILGIIVFWHKQPAANNSGQVQGKNTRISPASAEGRPGEEQSEAANPTGQNEGNMGMSTSTPPAPAADNGALNDRGQKVFTIHGGNFYFAPNQITVNKGDKVKIVFEADKGFHDFVLDEFNVKTERVSGGQTTGAEFTADKTGTFEFYCSVGSHRAMGMKGQLTVQ